MRAVFIAPFLALPALTGCAGDSTGVVVDPTTPEALIGVWQRSLPGELETSVEILSGNTWREVEADFGTEQCSTSAGTWTVSGGALVLTRTEAGGLPVSGPAETLPYTVSGTTLTVTPAEGAPESYARIGQLPTCPEYGWPTVVLVAEVDGVTTDFSEAAGTIDLADAIDDGLLSLEGWFRPSEGGDDCPGCDVLGITVWTELATPLVVGTYPVAGFGDTGLRGSGVLQLDDPATGVRYGTNDSDPETQPWQGEIVLTTVDPLLVEGYFSFVLYDGSAAGPPYPSVQVTNGSLRIVYE